ncbi:MAG: hypothetical protein ACRC0A_05450, partial [Chitinophagaceae bacterium]
MTKYYIFIMLLLVSKTFLKAQNVLHADFVKNPILIDGKIEDWQEDFHFFDGSSGFFYAVSN